MAFESVPDDIESFFNSGGEVPQSLAGEITTPPVETPPEGNAPPSESSAVAEPPKGTEPPAGTPPAATPPKVETPSPDYAAQLRQQQATLDALTKTLTDMQAAKKAAEDAANAPVAPDKDKDPLGYLDFQIKQVADRIEAMQKGQEQTKNETDQQTQFRQFVDGVNSQVNAHMATMPDYDPVTKTSADYQGAYKHLVEMRAADYMAMGYTQDQARQAVGQEELKLAANALREGKNPAVVAYDLAKRHGYVPKVQTPQTPPPESKLDSIKKGLETTGAERGAPPPTYSTESVKSMSGKQLTDAVENHWDEMFGRSKSKGIFD